jgi:uncharacterized protein YbcI
MYTQGEAEAAICVAVNKFMQQYMGKGASNIKTCIIADMFVVRISGMLTETEKRFAATPAIDSDLLKSVRRCLMVNAGADYFTKSFFAVLDTPVLSIYYDCSLSSNEEFIVVTLLEAPIFREKNTGIKTER